MRKGLFFMTMGTEGTKGILAKPGTGMRTVQLTLLSIFLILLSIVTLSDYVKGLRKSQVNLDKEIPFKCTECGGVYLHKIRDLQKMQNLTNPMVDNLTRGSAATQPMMGPMMGPLVLECPKCHKKALTQAVECPKCKNIFVMKMDPGKNLFDDKCPRCKESYAKAWQEKYRKEQGGD